MMTLNIYEIKELFHCIKAGERLGLQYEVKKVKEIVRNLLGQEEVEYWEFILPQVKGEGE